MGGVEGDCANGDRGPRDESKGLCELRFKG